MLVFQNFGETVSSFLALKSIQSMIRILIFLSGLRRIREIQGCSWGMSGQSNSYGGNTLNSKQINGNL